MEGAFGVLGAGFEVDAAAGVEGGCVMAHGWGVVGLMGRILVRRNGESVPVDEWGDVEMAGILYLLGAGWYV